METARFVGIDVAKVELVVAALPGDERWTVENDEKGIRSRGYLDSLTDQLRRLSLPATSYSRALETRLASALEDETRIERIKQVKQIPT